MEKSNIKSAISIEYGLSREQTDKVVNSIFSGLSEYFVKNKKVEIQKFGKFKPVTDRSSSDSRSVTIKFSPSKKLSNRINSDFGHLKKVKFKYDERLKNFVKSIPDGVKVESIVKEKQNISSPEERTATGSGQRKLISEDLIKLHKEIVSETNDKKDVNVNTERRDDVNNLWR